ncbi:MULTISPECIES: sulfite exporter TauE/SafE family protein [unclassified Francisella]|uniref:sulfite exporter TauE/SafE family protein n=1 Tax=unclassified Francisella TaxID=2610885 RepID=UPI002E36DF89|nr:MULTISPECIES: sulfite exporter TauE/SafE family protein [unclassified Francisella]MED7820257.1 sulfite exporter TauE/SafE family protein [Francisella sp. 19S2-4]MED7831092.1 sulfite exporter TauE/SafE family protein [Francisella sp. 19S2-10]
MLAAWVGAGGGAVIIPVMLIVCKYQGISNEISIHLAISTSLAFIMVNAIYSSYKHFKHGNLITKIFKNAFPTIIIGAALGTIIGQIMPAKAIEILFAIILLISLIKTFRLNKAHTNTDIRIPSKKSCLVFGCATGLLSSIVGIGGSSIVNPYMKHYNYPMRNCAAMAVSTSFPVALISTITMLVSSYHALGIPAYSFGYLYLPAFLGLLVGSLVGTSVGIRIVKRCPETISIWLFRIILIYVIIDML